MVYVPDFQGQSIRAQQAGLQLGSQVGRGINNALMAPYNQQLMQQRIQSGELGLETTKLKQKLLQQQIQAGELGLGSGRLQFSQEQDQADQASFIQGMANSLAVTDKEKRDEIYMGLKEAYGDKPGIAQVMDSLIGMDNEQQLENVYGFINNQFGKGGSKPASADIAEFEKLEELKSTGTPEQVQAFEKIIGIAQDKKLSGKSERALIDAQDAYINAGQAAREMEVLRNDISRAEIGGGIKATFSETLKDILGTQDEVSRLRRRFRRIITSEAISSLPPGPATDKDIENAFKGFPKDNANVEQIKSFLTGASKLARINERFNEFKAEYIGENESTVGLIKAWKEKTKDVDYLSDILNPKDDLLKVQDTNVLSDEDLLKKYGGR